MIMWYQVLLSKRSIWPTYRTLTGTTSPGQSRPGCNGNEEVLYTPQSSRTGASSSDAV